MQLAPIAIFPFGIRNPLKRGTSEAENLINHIEGMKPVKTEI
jgi:hypothetical protein